MRLQEPTLLRQACYIDGDWVTANSGQTLGVSNPATGQQIATVPSCGAGETERAIAAASRAFVSWRETTAAGRGRILRNWFDLMMANQEDLARIMTSEQGKPLAEARGEIAYAAAYIEWFSEEARRVYGQVIPSPWKDRRIVVLREPVGVCAAITPWNFPSAMITRKVAPALAAGCTIVLKPAEQTPLSALAMAELAARAGVPAGVFNVVTGDPAIIGGVLTASPVVRKLSFTGSTRVGRLLMQQSAATLKRLSLELGGNAPFLVFDDADVDAAVTGAIASRYRNAGQTCVCANRFLVQEGIYRAFSTRLSEAVSDLKVGDGMEDGVHQGPLINVQALARVETLIDDAVRRGARVACGGRRHDMGGTWYMPTVLTEVTADMDVARTEIFGPVSPLLRFRTEEEAVRMANDTEAGLAAYLYSKDHSRIWRVSGRLEYGMVGINTGLISTEVAPFGGVKSSGFGREGSSEGILEYVETRYLAMGGL